MNVTNTTDSAIVNSALSTNSSGGYSISLITGKDYSLEGYASGYENGSITVTGLSSDTVKNISLTGLSTVSGTVENQNGDPVKNATVQVWGVDYDQLSPDAGETKFQAAIDQIEAAKNKTPEDWTNQLSNGFQLTGAAGHFESLEGTYVAVHRAEDWQPGGLFSSHVFENPDLENPLLSVSAPDNQPVPVCFSVWDASQEEGFLGGDGVKEDLPGQPVSGTPVIEQVGPGGDTYEKLSTSKTELSAGGFVAGTDYSNAYQCQKLSPGFYEVYPEGNPGASYLMKVGNPIEIIVDDLENEAGNVADQASQVAQDVTDGLFVKKTTTTDASGAFSVDVGSTVNTVAIQAYKAEDVDVSDVSNLDYQTIVDEYESSFDPTDCTRNDQLGSVYLPSSVKRVDTPASDVTVTMNELSFPSYANQESLACAAEDRLQQLLNETLSGALGMMQQRLNATSREELEQVYTELSNLYEQNERLQDRVEQLLAEQTDDDEVRVIVNESDATDQELKDRINSLEEAIDQLRTQLEGDVETTVGNNTLSQIYTFQGDLDPEAVTLFVHYSNGTTTTLTTDSDYLSVNKRPGLADQVVLEEYPIGENDPATLTTEVLVAGEDEGALGRVRDTVTNPNFDNAVPKLDSISVTSLNPGPSEQVGIDVNPEDPTAFGSLTSVTVHGPSGEITTDSVTGDGQETGFRTNGAGLYHVRLQFNNTEGDTFTETFRLTAGEFDHARPGSIQIRTGPTGRWLLVGDGLEGGSMTVGENGREVTIAAQIAQGDDAPGSVHVYTQGVDTGSEQLTTVKLTRGSSDESVQKQLGVVIHGDQLSENAVLWREDPTQPLPRDGSNQYGIVDSRSNGTTIQTYTESDGAVTVATNTEPGTLEEIFYELRLQGVPVPSFGAAGLFALEVANAAPSPVVDAIEGAFGELVEELAEASAPLATATGPTGAPA